MYKKLLFAMVFISLLFNLSTFVHTANLPPGSGTSGDPYQIGTLKNLTFA